jgi:hypothetical protein
VRRRWQHFVDAFLAELPNSDPESAALRAVERSGGMLNGFTEPSDKLRLRRAKALLKQPDVVAAIRAAYEVGADYSITDGMKRLVDWIEGRVRHEQTKMLESGEVVKYDVTLEPSLEALKTYLSVVTPKPAKQVQVDSRSIVAKVLVTDQPPKTRARILEVKALPSAVEP